MRLIYSTNRQLFKVRLMQWLSLACALFAIWYGFDLAQTYGLRPADGGRLAPLPVRLAWGFGVSSLGLAFLVGMGIYGYCYIAKILVDSLNQHVEIVIAGFLRPIRLNIAASDVIKSRYNRGRLETLDQTVNAPWFTIQLKQRSLPLILDVQGEVVDEQAMRSLFRLKT